MRFIAGNIPAAGTLSYPELGLHRAEQVKCLQRSHIVDVGSVEVLLQGRQDRVVELEKRKLQGAVALDLTFPDLG